VSQASDIATILAAINARYPSKKRAYSFGDPAAKTLTSGHILVLVTRRFVADQLLSGEVTIPGGRVYTRYVGTSEADVYAFRDATAAALEDKILAGSLGPFTFETSDSIDDAVDSGTTFYVSTDTFTY